MDLFADTIAPVRRTGPDQLFLVRLEIRPAPDNPEAEEVGGAFANCWVDADDLRTAEQTTLEAVEREGWEPHRFEEWKLAERREPEPPGQADRSRESLEQIEEAYAAGYSLAFYCWPVDAPDADENPPDQPGSAANSDAED